MRKLTQTEAKEREEWYRAYEDLMEDLLDAGRRDWEIVDFFLGALTPDRIVTLARELKIGPILSPRDWSPRGTKGYLDLLFEGIERYLRYSLHNLTTRSYTLASQFSAEDLRMMSAGLASYGLSGRREGDEISFDAQGRPRWGSRAAGILFRRKDGRFLLVLRSAEVLDPGVWGIPGGRVEPGEDVKKGARLETEEELGKLPPFKIAEKDVYRSGDFEFTTFLGEMKEGDAARWVPELNWEHDEWGWFPADRLPEPIHPNVAKVIRLWA
jgi:8-oxo-dGTP pyrophosphatase MutT (NUDIX family)